MVAMCEHLQQQHGPASHPGEAQDVEDALKMLQVEGLGGTVFSRALPDITVSALFAASVTEFGHLHLVKQS